MAISKPLLATSNNLCFMPKALRSSLSTCFTPLIAIGISTFLLPHAKADPPPTTLPVFCWRFTDVKQVDAATNTFQFEFEVLNWTTKPADALTVYFPLPGTRVGNVPSGDLLNKGNVAINSASVDSDGRFLPPGPAIPPPGNQPTQNGWSASLSTGNLDIYATKTAIYQHDPSNALSKKIPNIDLVQIVNSSGTTDQAIAKINDLPNPVISPTSTGSFPNGDFNPINDPETIDNGTNVLDGFVFEASSFDPGDYIVLSWFLGPDVASPAGNGILGLARDSQIDINFSPVGGFSTTGFSSSNPLIFASGSPLVGSQYGFTGVIGANVPLISVGDIQQVPAPLPVTGAAFVFASIRRIRATSARLKQLSSNIT